VEVNGKKFLVIKYSGLLILLCYSLAVFQVFSQVSYNLPDSVMRKLAAGSSPTKEI
jgi:hypothetical protein